MKFFPTCKVVGHGGVFAALFFGSALSPLDEPPPGKISTTLTLSPPYLIKEELERRRKKDVQVPTLSILPFPAAWEEGRRDWFFS